MDADDMTKLFQEPMTPRPEALLEAARKLIENEEKTLVEAADKRLRKAAERLRLATVKE